MRLPILIMALAFAGCAEGDAAGGDVFPLAGDEVRSVTERTVRLDGRTLVLDANAGSFTVVGTDADEAHLRFERVARGSSATTAQKRLDRMTIDEAGDGEIHQVFVRGDDAHSEVHVEARVPRTAALHLRLGDGPVRLADTMGEVTATAERGSVEATGLAGLHVTLQTQSGDVAAQFTALPVEADVRLAAESGNVAVGLPAGADVDVAAETAAGTIAVEGLPFAPQQHDRGGAAERFRGRIGGGAARVQAVTGAGTIRLSAGR